jgi:hypothetical protein
MKYKRRYKTITITVSLSEENEIGKQKIDDITTNLIYRTTKTINTTITSHNRFKRNKIDNDGIEVRTFPNNI